VGDRPPFKAGGGEGRGGCSGPLLRVRLTSVFNYNTVNRQDLEPKQGALKGEEKTRSPLLKERQAEMEDILRKKRTRKVWERKGLDGGKVQGKEKAGGSGDRTFGEP